MYYCTMTQNSLRKYGYLVLGTGTLLPIVSKDLWTTAWEAFAEAERVAGERKIIICENRSEETQRFLRSRGLATAWLDRP